MKKTQMYRIFATLFAVSIHMCGVPSVASESNKPSGPIDVEIQNRLRDIREYKMKQFSDSANWDFAVLDSMNNKLLKFLKRSGVTSDLFSDTLTQSQKEGLGVITSSDKRIRFYSWDTLTGGTMHVFNSLVQYQPTNGDHPKIMVLSSSNGGDAGPGTWYDSVDAIRTEDGKTIYVAIGSAIGSTIDHTETIEAFSIRDGSLVRVPFFRTKSRKLNQIACDFHTMESETHIELEDGGKTLKIPIINQEGTPNGKYLIYKFDGKSLVFQPGK